MSEFLQRAPWLLVDYGASVFIPGLVLCLIFMGLYRLYGEKQSPLFRKRCLTALLFALALPLGLVYLILAGKTGSPGFQWWLFGLSGAYPQVIPSIVDNFFWGICAFYVVGMVVTVSVTGSRYLATWHLVRMGGTVADKKLQAMLDDLAAPSGVGPVRLLVCGLSPGPAAWGIRNPVVLIPGELAATMAESQLRQVFLHELGHHRNRDILAGMVLDFVATILWFNPCVWMVRNYWLQSCEELNDTQALERMPRCSWQEYGTTLLEVHEWQNSRPQLAGSRALAARKSGLGQRLRSLQQWSVRSMGKGRDAAASPGLGRLRAWTSHLWPVFGLVCFVLANLVACTTYRIQEQESPPFRFEKARFQDIAVDLCAGMHWDKAAMVYRCILENKPGDEVSTHELSKILLLQGKFQEAIGLLDRIERDSGSVHTLKGRAWDYLGRHDLALPEYRRGLEIARYETTIRFAEAGLERPLEYRKTIPLQVCPDQAIADRSMWSVWSTGCSGADDERLAIDTRLDTRWTSGQAMAPGMEFILDLGCERQVTRMWLVDDAGGNTIYVGDYPRWYSIQGACVPGEWQDLDGGKGWPDQYAGAAWLPRPIRYLRVQQHGRTSGEPWSIYDIRVHEATGTEYDLTGQYLQNKEKSE